MTELTKPKRRWFQFSLLTLLFLTAVSAAPLWLWTRYVASYRAQARAAAALRELGAVVTVEPAGPAWLLMLVGEEGLGDVTGCTFFGDAITDADLEHLEGLTHLEHLGLFDVEVTDAGLEHLKGLTKLVVLAMRGTQVTDAGVADLRSHLDAGRAQKALPNVLIHFGPTITEPTVPNSTAVE